MNNKPIADYPKAYLYRRIVQAKLYIDAHNAEPIDLNEIANEACFSKFHFIRLFKELYGNTPHQYLIQVRVAKAKLLLHTMDVAAACYAVGFDSIPTFTLLFKKVIADTPAKYRAKVLTHQIEVNKLPLKFIPNCFAEASGVKNSNFQ